MTQPLAMLLPEFENRTPVKELLELAGCLSPVSDSAELDIQLLLSEVMTCSRAVLLAFSERRLNEQQREKFIHALERRLQGEPMAYILGKKAFWDFELQVDNRVLVPRPETELLLEKALQCLAADGPAKTRLLDLGTGSGAIAIALARHNPEWQVTATDQSEDCLALAAENASRLQVGNISFVQASWFSGIESKDFDLIVSNPPYVAADDPHLQDDGLPFEPQAALVAGNEGFDSLSEIIAEAGNHLAPGGWLLLEHGFNQAAQVREKLLEAGFDKIRCWQDLGGFDRVTQACYPG